MIKFRKDLDGYQRYEGREEIKEIISSDYSDYLKLAGIKNELETMVDASVAEANADPNSRAARFRKILSIAMLRDFEYGNRRYPFLKGRGYSSLYLENYNSTDKIISKL